MASLKQVCRLCLAAISNGFETLDTLKEEMLQKIALNLDLNLTDKPVVCLKCRDVLQKSYEFKTSCFKDETKTEAFLNYDKVKLNSEEIDAIQNVVKREDDCVCRLCLKRFDRDSFLKCDADDKLFKDMLHKCLPEIGSTDTNRPLICHGCKKNCHVMFAFTKNCLDNEEKIKKYIQTNGTTSNGRINLTNALRFIHDTANQDRTIERDLNFLINETLIENLNSSSCGDVGNEETFEGMENDEILRDFLSSSSCRIVEKGTKRTEAGNDVIVRDDLNGRKCVVIGETETLEGMVKDEILDEILQSSTSEVSVKKEQLEERGVYGEIMDEVINKSNSHKDTASTNDASSQAPSHECTECSFKSRYKRNLRKHSLIHKDVSKVAMHKCTECNYASKYKHYLRRHLLIHRDSSKVPMHKCTERSYESNIQEQLSTHKDTSGVAVYRCAVCGHGTRRRSSLQKHMLVHKSYSDVVVHKCTTCGFVTKYKNSLLTHMSVHEDDVKVGNKILR